ncbi:MAG: MBL fold metallo-hydrolase [Gemmatimonadales bacterium]
MKIRHLFLACAVIIPPPLAAQLPPVQVITLGTGGPFPDPHHQGPATAVTVGDRLFLFDAGTGVERQLRAAGLSIAGPTALFLTHLHTDHTLGLADLILTSWVMRRTTPFPIFGPKGTRAMVDHLLAAYSDDIRIRTEGLEHEVADGWRVTVREIAPGVVFDSGGVRVTAVPVRHGSWPEAFGYRVDAPGRTIVISGDTRPSDSLEVASRGVDVLVHEVYPSSRVAPEARPRGDDWPAYLRSFHTSGEELGALAARAHPKLLVLTHVVRMGASDSEVVAGVRRGGYTGPIAVAKDLDRY